jgi:crotonobetainyl-CoA:carnitine CoA-transferase CaiB-like acyl-CoA transferase
MGGLMSVTGLPGQGPVRVGIPIADLSAGLFCALGIMTALLERETSGEGQWVSTSLLQAQIFMLDFQASRFLTDGQVAKQAGNNHPTSIPTGVFKTKDGYLNIAVAGAVIWERFCNAAGHAEWITSPDYKNGKARLQNRDALNAEIDKATATKSTAEWVEIFNKIGVPCGPIYNIDQVFADPQVKHLGMAQESARSDGSRLGLVGQPFKLSRTPSKIAARPPNIGEHTDEILKEFGFADQEIAALHEAKAV